MDRYERVRRREFPAIPRLTPIGRLVIALRIAHGLTQRELAERPGVSESLVSRDEESPLQPVARFLTARRRPEGRRPP